MLQLIVIRKCYLNFDVFRNGTITKEREIFLNVLFLPIRASSVNLISDIIIHYI